MNSVKSKIHEVVIDLVLGRAILSHVSNRAWNSSYRRILQPTTAKLAVRNAVDAALDSSETSMV